MTEIERATEKLTEKPTEKLVGKRALVTGGTRGIGAAIVRALLREGAEVLTTARSRAGTAPEGARFVAADVRTPAGARALADAVEEAFGGVDIVVHNAGAARPYKDTRAIPDEEWQDALDVNFLASVRLDALLTPGMRERGAGAIVHVSTAAVRTPMGPFLHYTAAKAALENYSRGLALELAPAGVRVNTVSPGRVTTPGGLEVRDRWAALGEVSGPVDADGVPPLGRVGEDDDIAEAVLYLVSGRAGWVTGSNLIVDGGEFPRG